MSDTTCPECLSVHVVKNGRKHGRPTLLCNTCGRQFYEPPVLVREDKKEGVTDWREIATHLQETQRLHEKASWSQDQGIIRIDNPPPVIVFKPLSDAHLGSIGTDYASFVDFSDSVLSIPYLYTALLGDETDNFVSFKNQLAVVQQILSPEKQDEFVESWLVEMTVKILFAIWGNHGEFDERVSGKNPLKKILNRKVTYFNGIGICHLKVGEQTYKIVATHKTRYNSSFNKTHGLKQLARKDIPDADLYMAGHDHDPAYENSYERGMEQWFVKFGTLKKNDGFGKRYFSFFCAQRDAAITLDSRTHKILVWPSLEDALHYAEQENKIA